MFQSFRHSFRQRGLSLDLGLKSVEGLSLEVWKVHPLDLETLGSVTSCDAESGSSGVVHQKKWRFFVHDH